MTSDSTPFQPPPPPSPPSPAHPSQKRPAAQWLIAGVAVVLVATAVAAVGGYMLWNRSKVSAYCEVYDQTHAELVSALQSVPSGRSRSQSLSEMESEIEVRQQAQASINASLAKRRDAAPNGALRDAWTVLMSGSGNGSLSAERERAEAESTVNKYAEEKCDLKGDM